MLDLAKFVLAFYLFFAHLLKITSLAGTLLTLKFVVVDADGNETNDDVVVVVCCLVVVFF